MFDKLMEKAKELESYHNTEWAEENSDQYDMFADKIEMEWSRGNITDEQFDELALTAFYDYPDGLKFL